MDFRVTNLKTNKTKVISDPDIIEQLEGDPAFTIEPIETKKPDEPMGALETGLRSAADTALFGFSDEIGAAGDWIQDRIPGLSRGKAKDYKEYLAARRAQLAQGRSDNPTSAITGNLVGAIAGPGGAIKDLAKLSTLEKAAQLAKIGAKQGAIQGVGQTDIGSKPLADSAKDVALSTVVGGAAGPAMAAGYKGLKMIGKGAVKTAEKLGDYIDPSRKTAGVESVESLIAKQAKTDIGPSRVEKLKENESHLASHDDLVKGAIKNKLQRTVQDDMTDLNISLETITDEAHTGLKGSRADKAFRKEFAGVPLDRQIAIVEKAGQDATDLLNHTEGLVDNLIKDAKDGLGERSSGSVAKGVKDALSTYRSQINAALANGASPETMSELYIAVDKLKRKIGKMEKKVERDAEPREKVQKLYEEFRLFLEDPDTWLNMSLVQKDLNESWTRFLEKSDAISNTFYRPRNKQSITSNDTWSKVSHAEGKAIEPIIDNPDKASHIDYVKDLEEYLDRSKDLASSLTRHYKPTPELKQEVARIEMLQKRIKAQLDLARVDHTRSEKVGLSVTDKASENAKIAKERGVEHNSLEEIDRLLSDNSSLNKDQLKQDESYREALVGRIDKLSDARFARKHPTANTADKLIGSSGSNILGRLGTKYSTPSAVETVNDVSEWIVPNKSNTSQSEFDEIDEQLGLSRSNKSEPLTHEQLQHKAVQDAIQDKQSKKPKTTVY